MPRICSPAERAALADAYATSFNVVEFMGSLYLPVHFQTKKPERGLLPEETIWLPMDQKVLRKVANRRLNILFQSDTEERSFRLMLEQFAKQKLKSKGILVRQADGTLKVLMADGKMKKFKGEFTANFIDVPYDPNNPLVQQCFSTIADWVGGEDQAHSLLYHLATALQNEWSARKYVLLIGAGYNGKGTLIKMINKLFGGQDNISQITRQDMSEKSPIVPQINNMLINLVYDGPKEFLKDSSTEKTIIAGEPIWLRPLFSNYPVIVQSNCLFVEALNDEPRVSDKSPALQKRLVRFRFDNVYPDDPTFTDKMTSPDMIAAFLHLLIQHWVQKNELSEKLALTVQSLDLQMKAMWDINPVMRFLEWAHERDDQILQTIMDKKMLWNIFTMRFRDWLDSNGYKNMEDDYVMTMLKNSFVDDRKSFRLPGSKGPTTQRYIKSVLPDTLNVIQRLMQGESVTLDADDLTVMKDDDDAPVVRKRNVRRPDSDSGVDE